MLEVGTDAPDFSLPTHDGGTFSLSDQRGKYVILWWYPAASTPG